MPRSQRLLKFCILLTMPVTVIAAMGSLAGTYWFAFSGERQLSAMNSPSGHFRAVWVSERDARCVEQTKAPRDMFLKIERRYGLIKTGEFVPFCVSGDQVEGLTMRWTGNNELTVECSGCQRNRFAFYEGNWGDATFHLKISSR